MIHREPHGGHPRPPRFPLTDAILDRLPTDVYLQIATLVWLGAMMTPFLGLPHSITRIVLGYVFPIVLVITWTVALRTRTGRVGDRFEHRFWLDLEVTSYFLLGSLLIFLPAFAEVGSPWFPLITRGLLFVAYVMLLLASEMQPHREGFWRSEQIERRLSLLTVGLLGFGLFGYFAVTPALIDGRLQGVAPEGVLQENATQPIAFLFTILAGLLSIRFFSLSFATEDLKWRSIYRAIAIAASCQMLFHGIRSILPSEPLLTLLSLFSVTATALLIAAVQLRDHPFPSDWKPAQPSPEQVADPVEDSRLGLEFRTLLLALGVPLLHFVGYGSFGSYAGLFSPAYEDTREIWMLFWALTLGGLAYAQQQITTRRLLSILTEQKRIQRTLAAGERRLKMVNERKQADEAIYYSREKYAKAFRTCPYALAVMTRRDGRHLEANEQYLNMLAIDGRDLGHLRFPDLLEENDDRWRALDRHMRRQGSVRDFQLELTDRRKQRHSVLFSAESLRVDDEDCYVALCTDLSRREDLRLDRRKQQNLLSQCETPALVVDAAGRIVFANPAVDRCLAPAGENTEHPNAFGPVFEHSPELTAARVATQEGRNWMGRLPGRARDGSPCLLDCWWLDLERGPHTGHHRLILVFGGY